MLPNNTRLEYLEVPVELRADPALYFSRAGQCIVLNGPKGWIVAHYFGQEPPDAERYQFMTWYTDDYIPYVGSKVPQERKSNIKAWAQPVPTLADNRPPIYSGAVGSLGAAAGHTISRVELKPNSPLPSGLDADGIRLDIGSMDAYFNGSGFAIDKNGMRLDGVLQLSATTDRGVTRTSPLWGVVPKTAVTFFAVDFAPHVQKLQEYTIWIAKIVRVTDAIYRIVRLILERTKLDKLNRALDAFERTAQGAADRTGL